MAPLSTFGTVSVEMLQNPVCWTNGSGINPTLLSGNDPVITSGKQSCYCLYFNTAADSGIGRMCGMPSLRWCIAINMIIIMMIMVMTLGLLEGQ